MTPTPTTTGRLVLEFFHQFIPPTATAQQRRHDRSGASYLPASARLARATLQAVFEAHRPEAPITGPVAVAMLWTWPGKADAWKTTRPDLDNLAKLALDAATAAGWWTDDNQVADLHLAKFVGTMPGLAVAVMRLPTDSTEV